MRKLLFWTAVVWTFSLLGWLTLATLAASAAVVHGALIILRSLAHDRECHVCGKPYDHGVLGMHESCARSTRFVR